MPKRFDIWILKLEIPRLAKSADFARVGYMAVPKWHRSKSRQGQRRMHIFLTPPKPVACKKCGMPVLPHTLCENCGTYRGRELIDVLAKLNKKERKKKEKELAAQEAQNPNQ